MRKSLPILVIGILFAFAHQPSVADEAGVSVVFSDSEVRIIEAWYREHGSRHEAGQGRNGRGSLPPGIARNLARGKAVPPGIAKQYLPDGLRQALPAPPAGYERVVVDGKVLLVEIATQIIHDVLTDVILD